MSGIRTASRGTVAIGRSLLQVACGDHNLTDRGTAFRNLVFRTITGFPRVLLEKEAFIVGVISRVAIGRSLYRFLFFCVNGKNCHRRLCVGKFLLQLGNLIPECRRLLKLQIGRQLFASEMSTEQATLQYLRGLHLPMLGQRQSFSALSGSLRRFGDEIVDGFVYRSGRDTVVFLVICHLNFASSIGFVNGVADGIRDLICIQQHLSIYIPARRARPFGLETFQIGENRRDPRQESRRANTSGRSKPSRKRLIPTMTLKYTFSEFA